MTLVSIPAQSRLEDVVSGMIKNANCRGIVGFARGAPPSAARHGPALSPDAPGAIEIFRDGNADLLDLRFRCGG